MEKSTLLGSTGGKSKGTEEEPQASSRGILEGKYGMKHLGSTGK